MYKSFDKLFVENLDRKTYLSLNLKNTVSRQISNLFSYHKIITINLLHHDQRLSHIITPLFSIQNKLKLLYYV